jgi:hypothetical protein
LNAPNPDIKKDLKRLEEEHIFSELDVKIRVTDKEIIEGIFSLENKKSSVFLLNKKFSILVLSILANNFPSALPIVN